MTDAVAESGIRGDDVRWEYRVIRVAIGTVTFQKYGPDTFPFETTLNDFGRDGWEAFHAQALAENEALLLFLKRRVRA